MGAVRDREGRGVGERGTNDEGSMHRDTYVSPALQLQARDRASSILAHYWLNTRDRELITGSTRETQLIAGSHERQVFTVSTPERHLAQHYRQIAPPSV